MSSYGYMGFVGVTTGSSSIMKIYPAWADVLGLPTRQIIGHDLPPNSPAEAYRSLITTIRDDADHYGALVTTHKVNVFATCRDLFDSVDDLASLFGEISSVAKRGSQLTGAAKDPITVRLALQEFVTDDHFQRTGAHVLCLGTGGSGMALTHQLGIRDDKPETIICTARRQAKLDEIRELHERSELDLDRYRYLLTTSPDQVDEIMAGLPRASLVVNATGLGKDAPGSPLSNSARFPEAGIAWEFNYRGSLEFLAQARAQKQERNLVVEDGWRYFIHGWSQVIADVFGIEMTPSRVEQLGHVADGFR